MTQTNAAWQHAAWVAFFLQQHSIPMSASGKLPAARHQQLKTQAVPRTSHKVSGCFARALQLTNLAESRAAFRNQQGPRPTLSVFLLAFAWLCWLWLFAILGLSLLAFLRILSLCLQLLALGRGIVFGRFSFLHLSLFLLSLGICFLVACSCQFATDDLNSECGLFGRAIGFMPSRWLVNVECTWPTFQPSACQAELVCQAQGCEARKCRQPKPRAPLPPTSSLGSAGKMSFHRPRRLRRTA